MKKRKHDTEKGSEVDMRESLQIPSIGSEQSNADDPKTKRNEDSDAMGTHPSFSDLIRELYRREKDFM